jgi:uroporphyrinogen decarboxylase
VSASRTLSRRERLEACLSGARPDRPPAALWRHFPVDDQHPGRLAKATVHFQQTYDFDFVKVTPASSFCIRDWGARDEWRGNPEGTREYTGRAIQRPEDWAALPPLDPRRGALAAQLDCLRQVVAAVGPSTPVIQTVFSPLAQVKNLAGNAGLLLHLHRYPQALHAGLETIARTTRDFVEAALETGIAGVFYAVQHAQYGLMSEADFLEFGRRYDLQALEPARGCGLNVVHLHGEQVMFAAVKDYPAAVMNWHDRETPPSLAEGLAAFPGAACGGLRQWETMVLGDPEQVTAEAREAIQATGGRRFILGTGCVTPVTAPHGNLMAARRAVEAA